MKCSFILVYSVFMYCTCFASINGMDDRVILDEEQRISAIGGLLRLGKPGTEFQYTQINYHLNLQSVDTALIRRYGHGVCEKNLLYHMKSAYSCTVFLISEDEVMTAGHCIYPDPFPLVRDVPLIESGLKVVFGHDIEQLSSSNTYAVSSIVRAEYGPMFGDYAILKLDRRVERIKPLLLNKELQGHENVKTPLYTVGYPMGAIKQVKSKNASFRAFSDLENKAFFRSDLDINEGNSGSPVFNSLGEVIGLVSRTIFPHNFFTSDSFRLNEEMSCVEDLILPAGFNSSVIQRIGSIFVEDKNLEFQALIFFGAFERQEGQLGAEDIFQTGELDLNAVWQQYIGAPYHTLSVAILRYKKTQQTDSIEYLLSKGVHIDYVSQRMAELLSRQGDDTVSKLFEN